MHDVNPECQSHEHTATTSTVDAVICKRAASIFSALGDANRLRILVLLAENELCVSQIATAVNDNLPAVSQRLKLLRGERVVQSRREGKHIYYRLADQHIADLVSNGFAHAMEH